jgi:hydrogenase 3 maturation protease
VINILNEILVEFIKDYDKLIILGIGNELREDDALGSLIIQNLINDFTNEYFQKRNILLIDGGSAPENFTGLIKKENPSHLIIIDAVLMNQEPGTIKIINKDKISNFSISTHSMSLLSFIKYLELKINFKVILLGIQPKSLNLSQSLSPTVEKSIKKLQKNLISLINEYF